MFIINYVFYVFQTKKKIALLFQNFFLFKVNLSLFRLKQTQCLSWPKAKKAY